MKELQLLNSTKRVIIDDEDYDKFKDKKLVLVDTNKPQQYVGYYIDKGQRKIYLHTQVFNQRAYFKTHDRLDLRRANLTTNKSESAAKNEKRTHKIDSHGERVKTCVKCKLEFSLNNFYSRNLVESCDGYRNTCKTCTQVPQMAWYYRNLDRMLSIRKTYRQVIREFILFGYGGLCVWCKNFNLGCLELDHTYGKAHGVYLGYPKTTTPLYLRLIQENFPRDKFQLLCASCNQIKRKNENILPLYRKNWFLNVDKINTIDLMENRPNTKSRQYRIAKKKKVYSYYGDRCNLCDEADINALELDHVNNDGNEHRKIVYSSRLYTWLIKNRFEYPIQLLCCNCNRIKFRQFQASLNEEKQK